MLGDRRRARGSSPCLWFRTGFSGGALRSRRAAPATTRPRRERRATGAAPGPASLGQAAVPGGAGPPSPPAPGGGTAPLQGRPGPAVSRGRRAALRRGPRSPTGTHPPSRRPRRFRRALLATAEVTPPRSAAAAAAAARRCRPGGAGRQRRPPPCGAAVRRHSARRGRGMQSGQGPAESRGRGQVCAAPG